jgi:hypothetical protein
METPFGPIKTGELPTITISEPPKTTSVVMERTREGASGKSVVMPRLLHIHEMNKRARAMIAEKVRAQQSGSWVRRVYCGLFPRKASK